MGGRLRFRIPDFPLGALLVTILTSVALLFAFPDVPVAWFWQVMVAVAMIIWALGAGFFSEAPLSVFDQQQERGDETVPTKQDTADRYVSADFAALINTINAQGRANRDEERSEDRGKRLREQITIVLLGITMAAIISQVIEMRKVYEPIRDQAQAALDQADAAKTQAQVAKDQINAARQTATEARDNMLASQRAWVGPNGATIEGVPTAGNPVSLTVGYQNTGREPATGAVTVIDAFVVTDEQDRVGYSATRVSKNLSDCLARQPIVGAQVVYPTTGFGGNSMQGAIDKSLIDSSVVSGQSAIIVSGCLVYQSVASIHHSSFCFFYRAGLTKGQNLNFCAGGSYAD